MAHHITFKPAKTYATVDNAIKAVEKAYGANVAFADTNLRYVVAVGADGRFFPVFIGEAAVRAGVHFKFCVAA